MSSGDSLDAIEPWLGQVMAGLSPRQRKTLSVKIMRLVRAENAKRIAQNKQPDGSSMPPRKSRLDKRGGVKKSAKMFPRIRLARNMKISAGADGGEISFVNPLIEKTAAVHHYGGEDFVGKTKDGRNIRAKYAERQLLGFGDKERDKIIDMVADHMATKI